MDKLKSIYNITDEQIYKHHNKYLPYDSYQKKKIQTGILKANDYARLNGLQIDFYKKESNGNKEDVKEDDKVSEENSNLIVNNDENNDDDSDYGYNDSDDD